MFHDFLTPPVKISDTTQNLGINQFFHIPFTSLLTIQFNNVEPKLSNFVRIKNFSIRNSDHTVQPTVQKLGGEEW
jgi:hypothetical protein